MMLAVLENQKQASQLFDNPLPVAIFGFDTRTQQTLEIAFKNIGNNCASIVNLEHAQAAIFNFENQESRGSFLNFRKEHPGFPIIVISSHDIALRGTYVLTKPLRVGKFTEVFQAIQKQLATNPRKNELKQTTPKVGSLSTEPAEKQNVPTTEQNQSQSIPQQTSNSLRGDASCTGHAVENNLELPQNDIFYSPEKHLQSILYSAYKEAMVKKIVIEVNLKVKNDWGSITIFPQLRKIATDFDEQQLKYACSTPLYCFETKIVRYDESKSKKMEAARNGDSQLVSFESFNWAVALWTSNGRLPEGIKLDTSYRLRRWPNFTRLISIPHSFSMAALLSQKAININVLSKVADISQDYIYSFISCAYAADLLETATCGEVSGELLQSHSQKHPKRGLFERIINKLKLK